LRSRFGRSKRKQYRSLGTRKPKIVHTFRLESFHRSAIRASGERYAYSQLECKPNSEYDAQLCAERKLSAFAQSIIAPFLVCPVGQRKVVECRVRPSRKRIEPRPNTQRMFVGDGRRPILPGYSEACVSGHHEACVDPDCRCLHHAKVQALMRPNAQLPINSDNQFVCPRCQTKPRNGDLYCRDDGEKLVIPKKCECGQIGDKSDRYCGKCGKSFVRPITPIPEPELSEEEIAAIEAKARMRPSDVKAPISEVH
jgi:hypothetical protein